ncbi:hypothetical protein [Lactococcus lactis]|uniref:hypothetical protein n=1 Tax=Lactococcus lactis TaxID=1358 RepID=UPI00064016A8|nr:hypothetical protein [Lactococcus lactis]KLK96762.1 hypothetical protein VN91_0890 [Lactococcus lactis subsp. lactis]MDT2860921.1 hypothetical protein [Lactococcus lactis]MDT2877202.1 hypothetical protein [Lactococcus lactis]MDT2917453.1 hypothetical protein [Lactococcus lactis]MDT2919297.1 hypothetical protein [Lactococcus lactis]
MADAKTWATNNLSSFKQRMRISTEDSDELANLTDMLTASYTSILRLIGVSDASDPEVKELIFERSRYTYNDALDEFKENYKQNIRDVFLANQPTDDVGERQ